MQLKISLKIAENIKSTVFDYYSTGLEVCQAETTTKHLQKYKVSEVFGGGRPPALQAVAPPEKVKDAGIFMFTESLIEINIKYTCFFVQNDV